jgi:hypothetical protein
MAQIWRLKADTLTDITPGTTFIIAGTVTETDEVDNSATPWTGAWFEIATAAAGSSGDWLHVFIRVSPDGTNYNDANGTQQQARQVASLRRQSGGVAQRHVFHVPNLPAAKFKLVIGEATSYNLDATTVNMLRYTRELVAA